METMCVPDSWRGDGSTMIGWHCARLIGRSYLHQIVIPDRHTLEASRMALYVTVFARGEIHVVFLGHISSLLRLDARAVADEWIMPFRRSNKQSTDNHQINPSII